jgi:hypothetical protein
LEAKNAQTQTHPLLELNNLLICQGICLGNNRNQVDLGMEPPHNLDIQRLQGVAGWLDKVHAGMNSVVDDVHAIDLVLGVQVGIKALLNVIDNWAPRLVIVDKVAKAGCVNDGQTETDAILLNVGRDGVDGDGFGDDIERRALALLGRVEGGVEQGVYQGRFTQSRFTCNQAMGD